MIRASVCGGVALAVVACGQGPSTTTVVRGTPTTVPAGTLTVTLQGPPERSFIIRGGRWRVCDHGLVANATTLDAHMVVLVVTYVDHGAVVGRLAATDAPADGGAIGDLPAGARRAFTVCGTASAEPDGDQVEALIGG